MICPSCQASVAQGTTRCVFCGQTLSQLAPIAIQSPPTTARPASWAAPTAPAVAAGDSARWLTSLLAFGFDAPSGAVYRLRRDEWVYGVGNHMGLARPPSSSGGLVLLIICAWIYAWIAAVAILEDADTPWSGEGLGLQLPLAAFYAWSTIRLRDLERQTSLLIHEVSQADLHLVRQFRRPRWFATGTAIVGFAPLVWIILARILLNFESIELLGGFWAWTYVLLWAAAVVSLSRQHFSLSRRFGELVRATP